MILCPLVNGCRFLFSLYPISCARELNAFIMVCSPCVGRMFFGFTMVIMSLRSSRELCPETCMSVKILTLSFLSFSSIIALCFMLISAGITWLLKITWSSEVQFQW